MTDAQKKCRLAIVVPCLDEEEVFASTNAALLTLLELLRMRGLTDEKSFILYVDDGSRDGTWSLIREASYASHNVEGIRLMTNSGHQNALMAGMEAVAGRCDAVVTIDADLQDDVAAIPEMVEMWRQGADMVYGVRKARKSDTWFKRLTAKEFYRTMKALGVDTVFNHSDFRLLSARACAMLAGFGERNLFLRGIMPLIGGKQEKVYYDRQPRRAGKTKYPLAKMMNFAIDGITSFSVRPVRLIFTAGLIFTAVAFGIFIYVMIRHFSGETIEGWTSLMLSIWFCTGAILLALGVTGEYIGKIYTEVKHRPRFNVAETTAGTTHTGSSRTASRLADFLPSASQHKPYPEKEEERLQSAADKN